MTGLPNGGRQEEPSSQGDSAPGPLAGLRVLEYAQYVAGPLATMLLADLGADVVKVEPPNGDAWRHYAPLAQDESLAFYSLNRNKRSVVLDLKTPQGRETSDRLVSTADAVVHNMPHARAARFGLDREQVRRLNPRAVWSWVSAFGSDGPEAESRGYDLIAQAVSGLLMADVRLSDDVPRRSGGIPMADITGGILCCVGVLAGLLARERGEAPGIEVSLLGAALLTQIQAVASLRSEGDPMAALPGVTRAGLEAVASEIERSEALEPYYRCYETSDGYIAVACLNLRQRQHLLEVLGLTDPWVGNPQAAPLDEDELATRSAFIALFAAVLRQRSSKDWLSILKDHDVPAAEVRSVAQAVDGEQARANGLVQVFDQPGIGSVLVLGNLFKVGGQVPPAGRRAPRLGEHDHEVLGPLTAGPDPDRSARRSQGPPP